MCVNKKKESENDNATVKAAYDDAVLISGTKKIKRRGLW